MFYNRLMEQRVSVRQLNQETSAVIREVEEGHAVTVTRDGKPVARLVPITAKPSGLDRLVETGLVIAPTARGPIGMPPRHGDPNIEVSAVIEAMRDEETF